MKKHSLILLLFSFFLTTLSAQLPDSAADSRGNLPSVTLAPVTATYPQVRHDDLAGYGGAQDKPMIITWSANFSGMTTDGYPKYQATMTIQNNTKKEFTFKDGIGYGINCFFDNKKADKIIDGTLQAFIGGTPIGSGLILGYGKHWLDLDHVDCKSYNGTARTDEPAEAGNVDLCFPKEQKLEAGETLQFSYEAIVTDGSFAIIPPSVISIEISFPLDPDAKGYSFIGALQYLFYPEIFWSND